MDEASVFLSVLVEQLKLTITGWLGWPAYAVAILFIYLALKFLWVGRLKLFIAIVLGGLVAGIGGYLSAFQIEDGEHGLGAMLLSAFVINVVIVTMILAVPIYFLRSRVVGQIESEI